MRRAAPRAGLPALALVLALAAGLASAEVVQRGKLRVSFSGELAPKELPRDGRAPVTVRLGGRISTTNGSLPPQLRRVEIAINREGRLDPRGLASCRLEDIQPATTARALQRCGDAKVGEGTFSADVAIPGQAPFPSAGRMIAFNGAERGRPAIFAHVYGTEPVPTSYTLTFRIERAEGQFGTLLVSDLPQVTTDVGFITGLSLTLGRSFRAAGRRHGYLSSGCPAPAGFPGATFPLARVSFDFAGGEGLSKTLRRNCKAIG